MKGTFRGVGRSALIALGLAVPTLLAVPAQGAAPAQHTTPARHVTPVRGADVQFSYAPPQISEDGGHVSWHWSLRNSGTEAAGNVTLVHRLNPPLAQVTVSAPCTAEAGVIRCRYRLVPVGGTEEGTIDAVLPADLSGTVQISGRITWQQLSPPAGQARRATAR